MHTVCRRFWLRLVLVGSRPAVPTDRFERRQRRCDRIGGNRATRTGIYSLLRVASLAAGVFTNNTKKSTHLSLLAVSLTGLIGLCRVLVGHLSSNSYLETVTTHGRQLRHTSSTNDKSHRGVPT